MYYPTRYPNPKFKSSYALSLFVANNLYSFFNWKSAVNISIKHCKGPASGVKEKILAKNFLSP